MKNNNNYNNNQSNQNILNQRASYPQVSNLQNQSFDIAKQKRETFLAPTPSYNQEYSINTPGIMNNAKQSESKELNNEFMKGPNSSQMIDLIHHPSSTLFNGPSFFGVPGSPAYPNNSNTVNYFNMTPNNNSAHNISHIIDNVNKSSPYYANNNNNTPGMHNNNNNPALAKGNYINYGNNVYNTPSNNNNYINVNNNNHQNIANSNADSLSLSNNFPPSSYGIYSEISEDIKPKLQNIVSTANFKCTLDLRKIALQAKNAEYNPKRFAAVIMRIKEPKTTALIFASGKMVCTGARSEEDSRKAARQYAKIIQKLGYEVRFSEFKIQNIVGSCDVKFKISLEGLSASTSSTKFCSYEPEIFPGLIFKMAYPKIVLLIFVSGKIVLTGAKQRNEIFEAFKNIYPVLQQHKKKETKTVEDTTNSESNSNIRGENY